MHQCWKLPPLSLTTWSNWCYLTSHQSCLMAWHSLKFDGLKCDTFLTKAVNVVFISLHCSFLLLLSHTITSASLHFITFKMPLKHKDNTAVFRVWIALVELARSKCDENINESLAYCCVYYMSARWERSWTLCKSPYYLVLTNEIIKSVEYSVIPHSRLCHQCVGCWQYTVAGVLVECMGKHSLFSIVKGKWEDMTWLGWELSVNSQDFSFGLVSVAQICISRSVCEGKRS